MIERLLPAAAVAAEAFADEGDAGTLFAEERALLAGMAPGRRAEFITVRGCARRALGALGLPPAPVPRGPHGAPRWPAGLVGSLTHCEGYRAAVLARGAELAAVGIDAEPHRALPPGVLDAVASPAERAALADLRRASPVVHWDRLLFSAKESVYKAWYPLTGQRLDFADAEIAFALDGGWTAAVVPVSTPVSAPVSTPALAGRWLTGGGLLLTAVAVEVAVAATDRDPRGVG
ncbi:4'-phosphopantetheinyl transferase superfamily protein [Kitasatospora sp. NBC_01287]|uniref:4'-phosphopantetheinyl transferase family protein n=1 Tax=Kitasatospora sp. NBC_01287 TaxID=2903573 RepID=UPI00224FC7ED|nr:4'-phosphopantetheinyl transferase superfamily protein [Kitasatospora sp. NBC_01287]MCX4744998.1 4'-phosphopantetheinyl transferase superfamily protein [Kitasatospora sp. NBC_01287]